MEKSYVLTSISKYHILKVHQKNNIRTNMHNGKSCMYSQVLTSIST